MKTKVLLILIVLAMAISASGCTSEVPRYCEFGDFVYSNDYYNGYTLFTVADSAIDKEVLYIPDEVNGQTLKVLGSQPIIGGRKMSFGRCVNMKRVYFPWSIEETAESINWPGYADNNREKHCIISASTITFIDTMVSNQLYVVPNQYYISHQFCLNDEDIVSANIAFLFNYDCHPNQGYFFVDYVEESGTVIQPPYTPKREGYTFAGWYKESECINAWNFDTDVVTIEFDEEGNRIYEEICLYAKWIEK